MSFDAVAPWYRTLEWITFGDAFQHCRVACLGEIVAPRHALLVGEGNGRFLCELLRRYPQVEVDCVDASQQMLRLAQERVERELSGRGKWVRFLHQDITSWSPPERHYDLLVTHFLLDCFAEEELIVVVRRLAQAATHNAAWLLSDFCVPSGGFARFRARAWLIVMYQFFRLTAGIQSSGLIDPTRVLRVEGFELDRQHLFRSGMLKSEMWRRNS